jgi:hypothetical protein
MTSRDPFRRNIRPRTGWLGDSDRPWLRDSREQRWSTALRRIQEQQRRTEEQKQCSTA